MDSERQPIVPGVRLGVYVVEAPLGAGGMGSVYRAVDTRLNRPVASGEVLSTLPSEGLQALQDVSALRGVKPFATPGAFPGPEPSVYAYQKLAAQRNIFQVPVP